MNKRQRKWDELKVIPVGEQRTVIDNFLKTHFAINNSDIRLSWIVLPFCSVLVAGVDDQGSGEM